jgi:dolichol-phosphate mannosyltransferase
MTSGQAGLVSVVVPTYQEVENIRVLVERISGAMTEAEMAVEIIIVDDDSRDGTEKLVSELADEGFAVRVEVRVNQRNLSTAVTDGFKLGVGEFLVCMDADLSHPPEKIPEMVGKLRSGESDFVLGSRYVAGGSTDSEWGLFRWVNSKAATILARPLIRVKDPMSGFFALRSETFESAASLSPIGYKIALELLVKCRCRNVVEVPIDFADRQFGQSKLNLSEQLKYIRHLGRLYRFKCFRSKGGG